MFPRKYETHFRSILSCLFLSASSARLPPPLRLAPPNRPTPPRELFVPHRTVMSATNDRALGGESSGPDDEFGRLLGSDIFEAKVLPRLSVKEHFALAGVNRACRGALAEVEGVEWLRCHGETWSDLSAPASVRSVQLEACQRAALEGRLEVLKWLRAHGCEWDEYTCAFAAKEGHLEVLQWARENGCEWDKDTCARAAWGGHLEVLRWARESGCEWNRWTCAAAAEGGNLQVLQWARENGCEWDEDTCAAAARGGHLEVLQWARGNGCPEFIQDSAWSGGAGERLRVGQVNLRTCCSGRPP